jgi:hypothetical protein
VCFLVRVREMVRLSGRKMAGDMSGSPSNASSVGSK